MKQLTRVMSARSPSTRRRARTLVSAALAAAATLTSAAALAYPPPWKASDGVPSPGRTVASADDASAVAVNPALLPYVPDAELRWQMLWTDYLGSSPSRGNSFSAALPLWFLGTGLRLDALDPPPFVSKLYGEPYYLLRWGLGANLSSTLSAGASIGFAFAHEPALDHLVTVTAGLSYRPSPYISFGLVARDFNQPSTSGVERSYDAAVALRPLGGHRKLEVDLTGTFYERSNKWAPGVTLAFDMPRMGRARGDLKLFDIGTTLDAALMFGIDVNLDWLEVSGGMALGSALAVGGTPGFYAGAAVRAYRPPGVVFPTRFVKIRIDETPGVRGHTSLLRKLWRLAKDPEVDGVALVLKAEPASSFAHAEELGDALQYLKSNGKKSLCFLEVAGGRSLHVCSQADRIAMSPAGGLRFSGLSASYFFLGGLAEKLGLKVDFVRMGAHTTAAEGLTGSKSTAVGHDDHQELVERIENVLMRDVSSGRNIPVDELRTRLAKGPFLAREAKAAGLVDVLAYEDELGRVTDELMGRSARLADDAAPARPPSYWTEAPKIALVYLSGNMIDGESQSVPVAGVKLSGSATLARALRRAREERSVKAVVLRLETGGGSSVAADVILREAQLTAKVKPLIVSMGSAAASGGYYASLAGSPVFANRATVTGSIGIFYGKADVTGLMRMLGAGVDTLRTAPRADAMSIYRPFTDDERAELGAKVKEVYDTFVGRVCDGRKLSVNEVDKIARGKVWTGEQALALKLVDKVGGLRDAIDEAKRLGGAPDDALILELPEEDDSLLGALLKLAHLSSAAMGLTGSAIPPMFLDIARSFAPFLALDSGVPLALSEVGEEAAAGGVLTARARDDDEPKAPPRARVVDEP